MRNARLPAKGRVTVKKLFSILGHFCNRHKTLIVFVLLGALSFTPQLLLGAEKQLEVPKGTLQSVMHDHFSGILPVKASGFAERHERASYYTSDDSQSIATILNNLSGISLRATQQGAALELQGKFNVEFAQGEWMTIYVYRDSPVVRLSLRGGSRLDEYYIASPPLNLGQIAQQIQ